jgi:hypothetical protein
LARLAELIGVKAATEDCGSLSEALPGSPVMAKLSIPKCALVGAGIMAGLHAAWAGLVASGYAQSLMDFIFRLHFIEPVYRIVAFDLQTAGLLIAVTGSLGALAGVLVGVIVNAVRAN